MKNCILIKIIHQTYFVLPAGELRRLILLSVGIDVIDDKVGSYDDSNERREPEKVAGMIIK